MKDIADHLGISINAVSIALNNKPGVSEDTRKQINEAASALGYFSTNGDSTLSNKPQNICLLLNKRYLKNPSFYSKVVYGIENEAKKSNFDIIVNFFDNKSFEIPQSVKNKSVTGVLVVGTIGDQFLKELSEYSVPIVLVDHASLCLEFDSILTQNVIGVFNATKHLISKGHRELGFFGDIDFSLSFKERWLGFYECIRESKLHNGLSFDKISNYSITGPIAEHVINKNYSALADIISSMDILPTAWVCCNDETALALYYALDILKIKVPEDVSVIGFDDIELCSFIDPSLTTVRVRKELMGETAMRRLLERINNPAIPIQHISLPVSLIERASVKDFKKTEE